VSPPPLRQGDRGFAVLWPDQAIKRPRGSRARQPRGEKTWRTWPAQEDRLVGRRNRNAGVQKGGRSYPGSGTAGTAETRVGRPKASRLPDRSAPEKRDRVGRGKACGYSVRGTPQPMT